MSARLLAVPARGRTRHPLRGLMRRVGAALMALAVLAGTVVAAGMVVRPAHAWPDPACAIGGGQEANTGPEKLNAGATAWLPKVYKEDVPAGQRDNRRAGYQAEVNTHSLWEVVGARGLLWSYSHRGPNKERSEGEPFDEGDPEGSLEAQCSPVDASAAYLAQLLFEGSRFMAGLTIGLKQLAMGEAPFSQFYDGQKKLIGGLRDALFLPAVTLGVIVTGIWVMSRMRRRDDARETYSGMLGASAIVILLVALLTGSNFLQLTKAVDKYTATFNVAALDLLASSGPEPKLGPCYIQPTTEESQIHNAGRRRTSCMLYEMLLYNPWANGQFGTSDPLKVRNLCYGFAPGDGHDRGVSCDQEDFAPAKGLCQYSPYRCLSADRPPATTKAERCSGQHGKVCINLAVQQVIAQAYTRNETLGESKRPQPPDEGYTAYKELWFGVQYAMADKYLDSYYHWKGAQPGSRMATAISSALMNLLALLAIGMFAILTLFWHGVFFVAWILVPVVGAVAIFPPARRIVKAVAGIIVQAIFMRNVLGLLLVILLSIMNAINISKSDTALKVILMIIAAAAILRFVKAMGSGQMAPRIVQSAAGQAVLPGQNTVMDGTQSTMRWTGRRATGAVRQTGAAATGAAEGYRTASEESEHAPGSKARRQDVMRGALAGAVTGRRTATPGGRNRIQAERWSREGAQARGRTPRWVEQEQRERQARQAERRREEQAEREERRHQEMLDRFDNDERRG